ncbi:cytosolic phospholipase A2 zeta-like [Boleophthalmus pectinirostris]|uniref:cytosolic phospholipase A2 zeta-like n=1 Tax=Boleophthalmus pectinirostris TaxID=150288 RepID=UPI00242B0682|nr:cytosolic phospholipase A2 zeta-like [Boleophthalmus pectinirostris]
MDFELRNSFVFLGHVGDVGVWAEPRTDSYSEPKDKPQEYFTNGILMAAPLTVMDVRVKNLTDKNGPLRNSLVLKLPGAYERSHPLKEKEWLQFHVNQELETELGLAVSTLQERSPDLDHTRHLGLRSDCRSKEDLGVRLSLDVPPQEKEFLQKRRRTVARALQALLGLKSPPSVKQVPTVALVASGGGSRASTGFLGSLKGLKEIGVLEAVTYITTVSGSTWALSTLCQDENWSQNLESIISQNRKQMTKETSSCLTLEKIQYYHAEMEEKEKQGHQVSYVDLQGLVLEHIVFGQKNTSTLSEQQKTVKNGQNPLPIYTAVNVKDSHGPQCFSSSEWVEFTPFEVGLPKYGAFVRTEDFGSEFFLGHLIKKLPEVRVPYLIGIWSSVISVSVRDLVKRLIGLDPVSSDINPTVNTIEKDEVPSTLDTRLLTSSGLIHKISTFFKSRPITNKTFNFTRGMSLHQNYNQNNNFLTSKNSHPDTFPNDLTPSDLNLELRLADVVIVLSYSWDPDNVFKVLQKTCEFCEERKVPFPSVNFSHFLSQPQREVYECQDPDAPAAPVVLHLPLVNASFRDHKAPGTGGTPGQDRGPSRVRSLPGAGLKDPFGVSGVRRETDEEVALGRVDVSSPDSPFTTAHLTYSEENYDALIDVARYNVLRSKDAIVSALAEALSRK